MPRPVPTGQNAIAPQPADIWGTTKVIKVTPAIGTAVYASGDQVGGQITFTGVFREAGAGALIHSMTVEDNSTQSVSLELWLFSGTVSPAADNAAFSITDAEAQTCVGVISSGAYAASALNSVSTKANIGLAAVGSDTNLYGLLCSRGTPTYAGTADLTVRLVVIQD